MSTARPYHTTALLPDGRVLALGGWSQASAEIYDPATNSWSRTGAMATPRNMHVSAVLPNGKILAAGGANGSSDFTDTAEVFTLTGALVSLTPGVLAFGKQPLNTSSDAQTVALTNSGTTPVRIAATGLGGAHPGDFAIGADSCAGATVAPGGTCTVGVNFSPRFAGARSATIQISDDAPGSPHTVALSGAGVILPTIVGLTPLQARAGDPALTLAVTGTNFASGAVVQWGGSPRPTTVVSSTRLTAAIGAADLAAAAVTAVTVVNPGGDTPTSPPAAFFVTENGTEVTGTASGTSTSATGRATASMGGNGPGTPGSLSAVAGGAGTITVARYGGNPGGVPTFGTGVGQTVGGYLDVYAAPGQRFTSVTIVNCALDGASTLFWWNGGGWVRVSDQRATPTGCVTFVVGPSSSPSLAQLTGTYVAAGRQLAFPDVPTSDPAATAIRELSARGVIRGYGDGSFGPGDATLRAQMAALIARAMGWESEDHGNHFADQGVVDLDLWRNVGTLASYGVAQGYADGTYNPTGEVLKVQAILFISRAMVAKGLWQPQADDPALYPNLPATSDRERADRRDIATYIHYAGALPDTQAGPGQSFTAWDQPGTRAWFARALWQALVSYYGSPSQVP